MATLPRVIRALQSCDGRDEATLTQHARLLREAGFIPGGKRGVGAPHMTNRHAAILLLGIYGCATPKEAVSAVDALGSLRHHFTSGPWEGQFKWLEGRNLLDSLSLLIERSHEITSILCATYENDDRLDMAQIDLLKQQAVAGGGLIEMRFEIRSTSAEIIVSWTDTQLLRAVYMVDSDRFMAGEYSNRINTDRQVTISFSRRTIVALHGVVFGE